MNTNNPYERMTIAEGVQHVQVAEKAINATLAELHKTTGFRIEIDYIEHDFGPPVILLKAVAR